MKAYCEEARLFCGHKISMRFFSPEIWEKVHPLFELPLVEGVTEGEAFLETEFHVGERAPEAAVMDRSAEKVEEGELLLAQGRYPWRRFTDGKDRWWRQFDGLGQQFWDLNKGVYITAVLPDAIEKRLPFVYLVSVLALSPLLRLRKIYSIHAACGSVRGKGMVLSAVSGGGKSSCALALANRGHPLLTDERVFLRSTSGEGYQAASPSDVAKVSREAKERFLPSLPTAIALGEYDGDIYIKFSASGLPFQNECAVRAICCIEKDGRKESLWEPLKPARAVASLFPVTMSMGERSAVQEVFGFLMKVLSETPCFKLSMGTDMEGAVAALEDLASNL